MKFGQSFSRYSLIGMIAPSSISSCAFPDWMIMTSGSLLEATFAASCSVSKLSPVHPIQRELIFGVWSLPAILSNTSEVSLYWILDWIRVLKHSTVITHLKLLLALCSLNLLLLQLNPCVFLHLKNQNPGRNGTIAATSYLKILPLILLT